MSSTIPIRVAAEVVLPLSEPREATYTEGRTFMADRVEWSHRLLVGDEYGDQFSVTLFGPDSWNDTVAWSADYVPSWVPRPPDGWDAAVLAIAAEFAEAVAR